MVCIAIPALVLLMIGIRRHYGRVDTALAAPDRGVMLPSRVHAVVLVSRVNYPVMHAVAYARATRPSTLVALHASADPDEARALAQEWEARDIPVSLTLVDSPFRDITRPVIDYVNQLRRDSPRDVVAVYVPEYVVVHWWQQMLHNQSALRLKARLLFLPGVMVTSVPTVVTDEWDTRV